MLAALVAAAAVAQRTALLIPSRFEHRGRLATLFVKPLETLTELAAKQISGGTALSAMARQGGRDLPLWLMKSIEDSTIHYFV